MAKTVYQGADGRIFDNEAAADYHDKLCDNEGSQSSYSHAVNSLFKNRFGFGPIYDPLKEGLWAVHGQPEAYGAGNADEMLAKTRRFHGVYQGRLGDVIRSFMSINAFRGGGDITDVTDPKTIGPYQPRSRF